MATQTLLIKGMLQAPNNDPNLQKELDTYVPYEYIIKWIHDRESKTGIENRLLVIQSGLASGKSITIPSEIYNSFVRGHSRGGIICTQPRILTAVDNAKQISRIPRYSGFLKLGETIGWDTQYFKNKPRRFGLLSATTGILMMRLQLLADNEISSMYRFIIVDEAHERPLFADITLAALKQFLRRNAGLSSCPFVILMSATIDPFKFARYFLDRQNVLDNIIICSAAPPYERRKIFPSAPIVNIVNEIVHIIEHIMDTAPADPATWDPHIPAKEGLRESDDILVFLPGVGEIRPIKEALQLWGVERDHKKMTRPIVTILTGKTIRDNTAYYRNLDIPIHTLNIVGNAYIGERRVILSTNVAETGKTFPTLRYVIDAGFNQENEYNPMLKVAILHPKAAPLSRVDQRWGRVGRRFPGVVYPLYTEETYAKLPLQQYPDVITSSISPIILQIVFEQQKMKAIHGHTKGIPPYFRVQDIDMIDTPKPDTLADALEHANALGFIAHGPPVFSWDTEEFLTQTQRANMDLVGLTKMGRVAIELLSIIDSLDDIRMILAGFAWGYRPADLIAIALFPMLSPESEEEGETETSQRKRPEIDMSLAYHQLFGDIAAAPILHTIMGDTFVDGIVMAAAINELFEMHGDKFMEWSRQISMNGIALVDYMEKIDAACSALISLGFDVYRGVSILDPSARENFRAKREGVARSQIDADYLADAIVRFKRCVYDGYRLNLVQWDAPTRTYKTLTGLSIAAGEVEKKFGTDRIHALVFDRFVCKYSPVPGVYEVKGGRVSVLDGFIGYDPLFTQ